MPNVLMKCGCRGEATDINGNPVCATHFGLTLDAETPVETPPNLTGRFAHCAYGNHAKVPSSLDLAFFEYKPDRPEDIYYCGCFGWD